MFQWIINVLKWLKEFCGNITDFVNSNSSFLTKILVLFPIGIIVVWITPVLDILVDLLLKFLRRVWKECKSFFKFIFRIKTKIYYFESGNVKYYFEVDIHGKLKLIQRVETPTKVEVEPSKINTQIVKIEEPPSEDS